MLKMFPCYLTTKKQNLNQTSYFSHVGRSQLKNTIHLSKCGDPVGSMKGFRNREASHPANRQELQRALAKHEGFKRQDEKVINRRKDYCG